MTYWVFDSLGEAEAAQQACMDALPVDTTDGIEASVQITEFWAAVLPTTDGHFGFVACTIVERPVDASTLADEEWQAVRPPPPQIEMP